MGVISMVSREPAMTISPLNHDWLNLSLRHRDVAPVIELGRPRRKVRGHLSRFFGLAFFSRSAVIPVPRNV